MVILNIRMNKKDLNNVFTNNINNNVINKSNNLINLVLYQNLFI